MTPSKDCDCILPDIPANMAHHFRAREFVEMALLCAFPAAVFFGERLLVMRNGLDFQTMADAFRGILGRRGMAEIRSRTMGCAHQADDRHTLKAISTYLTAEGAALGESHITYYVEQRDDEAWISAIEFTRWPFAAVVASDPVLRRFDSADARGPGPTLN